MHYTLLMASGTRALDSNPMGLPALVESFVVALRPESTLQALKSFKKIRIVQRSIFPK